jgi:small subunit ribosomal protein S18
MARKANRKTPGKGATAARGRERAGRKKKILPLSTDVWVDYKDVNVLRRYVSERAKIRARRVSGLTTQQQQEVARAIKLARELGLLPYISRQVTVRKGGKRGDRDDRRGRRDRDDRNEAPAAAEGAEAANTDTDTDTEAVEAAVGTGEGDE